MRVRLFTMMFSIVLLVSATCLGQSPMDEGALAFQQRQAITNSFRVIEGTAANQVVDKVFRTLLATPTVQAGRALEYSLYLIDDSEVNAFSAAGGQVYLSQGIASLASTDFGVLASVVSHELGHQLAAHHYQAYLRKAQIEATKQALGALFQNSQKSADVQQLAGLAGDVISLKLSRNAEIEADLLGLRILAEAGVHPDWAVASFRLMASRAGEQSKLAAAFSDHPRWATREEKVLKAYEEAIEAFRVRWADATVSPAGRPPVVATLGAVKTNKDEKSKQTEIAFSLNVRNAREAQVVISFSHKNTPLPGAMAEYQLSGGEFGVAQQVKPSSSAEVEGFAARIPASALTGKERKLDAVIRVIADGEVVAESKPFKVSFPKP